MSELRFDGLVAVVSGAGRGLGQAYASLLAERGASVVVNDVDRDVAEQTAAGISRRGSGGAVAAVADVATEVGACHVVKAAIDTYRRIDIVVANAGTSWHRPFEDVTEQEVHDVMAASFSSTFHLVKAAWNELKASGRGCVVTTASEAVFGFAGRAHYAAAKGAVLGLANTLAVEGVSHGIRVNCVMPWGATRLARPNSNAPDPALAAAPVVWLCHPDCGETGQSFTVGGGRIARVVLTTEPPRRVAPSTPEAYRDQLAGDRVDRHVATRSNYVATSDTSTRSEQ